jgi:hypothetical protein
MEIPILKLDSFSYLGERRYLAHPFSTSTVCSVCMYQAAPATGAKLINLLPKLAGVP